MSSAILWPQQVVLIENNNDRIKFFSEAVRDIRWLKSGCSGETPGPELTEAISLIEDWDNGGHKQVREKIEVEPVHVTEHEDSWDKAKKTVTSHDKTCLLFLDQELFLKKEDGCWQEKVLARITEERRELLREDQDTNNKYLESVYLAVQYGISPSRVLIVASMYSSDDGSWLSKMKRRGVIAGGAPFSDNDAAKLALLRGFNSWFEKNPICDLSRLWMSTEKWFDGYAYPHNWGDQKLEEKWRDWRAVFRRKLESDLLGRLPDEWFAGDIGNKLHEAMKTMCGQNFIRMVDYPTPVSLSLAFLMGTWAYLKTNEPYKKHFERVLGGIDWSRVSAARLRDDRSFPEPTNEVDMVEIRSIVKAFYNVGQRLAIDKHQKRPLLQQPPEFLRDGSVLIRLMFPDENDIRRIMKGMRATAPIGREMPKTCDALRYVKAHCNETCSISNESGELQLKLIPLKLIPFRQEDASNE